MTKRLAFFACEAFLCKVLKSKPGSKAGYQCRVWVRDPSSMDIDYDDTKTIEVDLSKTPIAGLDIAEIDDFFTEGGLTTLGPRYPGAARSEDGHASEASIWLTETKFKEAQALLVDPHVPWAGTKSYQWQTILTVDDPNTMNGIRRYAGYHARRICSDRDGHIAFKVWNALADVNDDAQTNDVILRLKDIERCDSTSSGQFNRDGDEGPLFVEWGYANSRNLLSPKLPIGYGIGKFPSNFRKQVRDLPLQVHSRPYPEDYRQRMVKAIAARQAPSQ